MTLWQGFTDALGGCIGPARTGSEAAAWPVRAPLRQPQPPQELWHSQASPLHALSKHGPAPLGAGKGTLCNQVRPASGRTSWQICLHKTGVGLPVLDAGFDLHQEGDLQSFTLSWGLESCHAEHIAAVQCPAGTCHITVQATANIGRPGCAMQSWWGVAGVPAAQLLCGV